MNNQNVRNHAKKQGVRLWQIAAELGINDGNFSRKLRVELPENEQERIIAIIDRLAAQQEVRYDQH